MTLTATTEVSENVPLVVDLDGTLIKTDLLIETFFALLGAKPLIALRMVGMLRFGKARLKAELADHAVIDLHTLPFDDAALDCVRAAKTAGRKVYLASASDQRLVADIADHLGMFDGAFGSDGSTNLVGSRKADRLCEIFGAGGFDYIGNADVDVPVWDRCREPVAANVPTALLRKLRLRYSGLREIGGAPPSLADYTRAVRPHQWLKNVLLFVPLLAAHTTSLHALGTALLAFVAFSLCASSVYLLNDLLDLGSDRRHHSKRERSLASGRIPLIHAVLLTPVLLGAALGLSLLLPWKFLGVLCLYYATTLLYSLWLKRHMLIDVMTLAVLYTVRVFAGGVACGIAISPWLMGVSMFLFLCLALVKRYTELEARIRCGEGNPTGRGYALSDVGMLGSLAAASGYAAVVVLALYINGPEVHGLYSHPEVLWLGCLLVLYWISRVLMVAHRGAMDDDPVIFAIRDRVSQIVGLAFMAVVGLSI
ncbi:MAG: UbiA family prenyltransferase [Alphaproteobacteria bacterium]|nr:UbiA family prenyltransferase [Alphaproteobacteria bacterium]